MHIIYSVFPSLELAQQVSKTLLESRLIACANIIPSVQSMYIWQGKLVSDKEVILLLKTSVARSKEVMEKIRELHQYEMPAILSIEVSSSDSDFFTWVRECTKRL